MRPRKPRRRALQTAQGSHSHRSVSRSRGGVTLASVESDAFRIDDDVPHDHSQPVEEVDMTKTLLSALTLAGLAFTGTAFAQGGPACAEAQDDSWMAPEAVQDLAEGLGYTIENMGISEGNCYEVTGQNAAGEGVTAYLDPRTGEVVEEAIAQ